MRKLLWLLPVVMLTGCDADKLRFHYNDCVSIKNDFYGLTYGRVIAYNGFNMYSVLRKIGNDVKEWGINDREMTKVDSGYCSNITK